MMVFCNKCGTEYPTDNLNDLELIEITSEGSFVCSNCINDEMENERRLK